MREVVVSPWSSISNTHGKPRCVGVGVVDRVAEFVQKCNAVCAWFSEAVNDSGAVDIEGR